MLIQLGWNTGLILCFHRRGVGYTDIVWADLRVRWNVAFCGSGDVLVFSVECLVGRYFFEDGSLGGMTCGGGTQISDLVLGAARLKKNVATRDGTQDTI